MRQEYFLTGLMKSFFVRFLFTLLIVPAIALAMPVSFCLKNTSSKPLGPVVIYFAGGQTTMTVSGGGNWTTDLPSNVIGISINGQRTNYPTTHDVTLPGGCIVRLIWKSSNLIEVIDLATQG